MSLREAWELRNAAAATMLKTEEQIRRMLEAATVADIVGLLEAFSPARSPGPEWTRSLDPLVERLWAWCEPVTLASVKAEFDRRGSAWAPVANALAPEHGAALRDALRRVPAGTRLPLFTVA
jgi:hypothetical protein